jgi:nitrate/nitrite transport system ATP-binding protein
MKQRVGIARAFAIEPKMLLLDEPFGALDALTRGVIQDELLKICAATHQTVFMITHDVDEAILLADKIMLMSNGPHARIAEIVQNTLPRNRSRHTVHKDPYYPIRNHLVDFLVSRSKGFTEQPPADYNLKSRRSSSPDECDRWGCRIANASPRHDQARHRQYSQLAFNSKGDRHETLE